MGYSLRTTDWRYSAWFEFDWNATAPVWSNVTARELYSHDGNDGGEAAGESFEYDNLADDSDYAQTVSTLHTQLVEAVKTGLVSPMNGSASPSSNEGVAPAVIS